jgi:crotonobetainyl-CoA:carnitine CoA-transferase CaiB-like acyl-CoA transferase
MSGHPVPSVGPSASNSTMCASEANAMCHCEGIPNWQVMRDSQQMPCVFRIGKNLMKSSVGVLLRNSHYEVMHKLQAARVAAGAVLSTGEFVEDEHIKARGYMESFDHPVVGEKLYPGVPLVKPHIRHLRQKVELDPDNPQYIVTVPGYTFTEAITKV